MSVEEGQTVPCRPVLLFDLYDRGADTIDRRLAVRRQVIAPRSVEIADISRRADEDDRSRKFERSLAVILLDVEDSTIRLNQNDRVAFVRRYPQISLRIERRPVCALQQSALRQQRRLFRLAVSGDRKFPNSTASRICDIKRGSLLVENNAVGGER